MILPKLIATDIDGVWTDGGMYYATNGEELKKFNTSDSAGVLFAALLGIEVAIITGENSESVKRRAQKLKIKHVFLGVKNKLKKLDELLLELNLGYADVAYIGDDINDLQVLKKVGISGAPKNAPVYIREKVNIVTESSGGEGAFREFVEQVLGQKNIELALYKYLSSVKNFDQ